MRHNTELLSPERYRELRDRPGTWVVDSSELMMDIFEMTKIHRILEFVARQVCMWCDSGSERIRDRYKYIHRISKADIERNHLTGLYWVCDGQEFECNASSFIDGPKEGEDWLPDTFI